MLEDRPANTSRKLTCWLTPAMQPLRLTCTARDETRRASASCMTSVCSLCLSNLDMNRPHGSARYTGVPQNPIVPLGSRRRACMTAVSRAQSITTYNSPRSRGVPPARVVGSGIQRLATRYRRQPPLGGVVRLAQAMQTQEARPTVATLVARSALPSASRVCSSYSSPAAASSSTSASVSPLARATG